MKKVNNYHIWIEVGYQLFAEEGHEGLQIERLSRITGLNKSGFYHYFGDTHEYLKHLLKEHERLVDTLIEPMSKLTTYDPGYLEMLLQHKHISFFQIQLIRNRHVKMFVECNERNNKKTAPYVTPLFCRAIGLSEKAAYPYYEMMRDMYSTKADFSSYTYEFLHSMVERFKNMVSIIKEDQPEH
jgi:AcrR family transcriptional regulator